VLDGEPLVKLEPEVVDRLREGDGKRLMVVPVEAVHPLKSTVFTVNVPAELVFMLLPLPPEGLQEKLENCAELITDAVQELP